MSLVTSENAGVTLELGREKGIRVIAGIEITSSEEVHILGLFPDLASALKMQAVVYAHLQPGENDEDAFGMQVVVNGIDEVLGFNKRLLIGATSLSVDRVVATIHSHDGLAIASHVDREGFGIIGQLGFIPPEAEFDALEISSMTSIEEAGKKFLHYRHLPWISSSDAHRVEDVGCRTTGFLMR